MYINRRSGRRELLVGVLPCVIAIASMACASEPPVATPPVAMVRVANFVVTPSTGPATNILVRNPGDAPLAGTLRVTWPAGWKVTPVSHELRLAAGETRSLPFAIERATDRRANVYPVEVVVESDRGKVVTKQNVVCASAPYYKPTIDGDPVEWKDAIPITLAIAGKKATVRQYWNRREFCLLVEVEEDALASYDPAKPAKAFDAIQFSLAKGSAKTGGKVTDKSERFEFLVTDAGDDDRCFALISPGTELAVAQKARPLEPLRVADAKVVIKRVGKITRYELSLPMKPMRELRPTPGREFHFSLLVHDADAGLRDLGSVMNLWESQRPALAWCRTPGIDFPAKAPFDNKVEFGFCSSIH